MNKASQKGIALILTLILMFVISVMAVSLMFISQTETWSSLNYRLMSQARDGAEAGVNSTANYIVNTYTKPGGTTDPTTAYGVTVSPVTYSGAPVYLSAMTSQQAANYPVAAVQTAFNTSGVGKGSYTSGSVTVNYSTYAELLSMTSAFKPFGSISNTTVQTWQITSIGTISGIRGAEVEVSAILEEHRTPTFNYAAFAVDPGCSALTFGGGGTTNSYDSTIGLSSIQASGGNIGTNGNLDTSGSTVTINGSLSTPRTGVGTCSSGNITAWTSSGSGTVTGGLVELPQSVLYPTPSATSPLPGTTTMTLNNKQTDCSGVTGCVYNTILNQFTLAPGACPPAVSGPGLYGNVTIKGTVHLSAGCYNINTLTENGGGTLVIDSGPVVINIAGLDSSGNALTGTVVDLTGGSLSNPSLVPSNFQLLYAGPGTVKLEGGSAASGLLYAPNAQFAFAGGGNWYGAVIGKDMTDMGGTAIHYDRRLQNMDFTVGPWMLDSFTWKKY